MEIITLFMFVVLPVWLIHLALKKISKIFNLVCPMNTHYFAIACTLISCGVLFLANTNSMSISISSLLSLILLFKLAGVSLIIITLSIVIDELWARQETSKRFNWFALIDDVVVVILFGLFYIGSTSNINLTPTIGLHFDNHIPVRIPLLGAAALISLLISVLVEIARPHVPSPQIQNPPKSTFEDVEIVNAIENGERVAFWDVQNPMWMDVLMAIAFFWLVSYGIACAKSSVMLFCILISIAAIPVLFFGGIRILVNDEYVKINLGLLNIKMVEIPICQIQEAELYEYAPLIDFGGYGVRFNGKLSAYYMRGNQGVLIKTTTGRQYLMGSDYPEKLLAIINAIRDSKD